MTVSADALRRLAALQLRPAQMTEVLSIIADMQSSVDEALNREAERKEADRIRKRESRAASKDSPRNLQGQSKENPDSVHGNGLDASADAKSRAPAPPCAFLVGEEVKYIPPLPSVVPPIENPSIGKPKPPSKSTRVPEDFVPNETSIAVGIKIGIPRAAIVGEFRDEFVDFWLGSPGVKGRKDDWQATYRVRLRQVADRFAPHARGSPRNGKPMSNRMIAHQIVMKEALERERQAGNPENTIDGTYTVEPSGEFDDFRDDERH